MLEGLERPAQLMKQLGPSGMFQCVCIETGSKNPGTQDELGYDHDFLSSKSYTETIINNLDWYIVMSMCSCYRCYPQSPVIMLAFQPLFVADVFFSVHE